MKVRRAEGRRLAGDAIDCRRRFFAPPPPPLREGGVRAFLSTTVCFSPLPRLSPPLLNPLLPSRGSSGESKPRVPAEVLRALGERIESSPRGCCCCCGLRLLRRCGVDSLATGLGLGLGGVRAIWSCVTKPAASASGGPVSAHAIAVTYGYLWLAYVTEVSA